MRTPLDIAEQIERAIVALGIEGDRSEDLIVSKAEAMGNYDRCLGVAVANLKADGMAISIIDKIAKERTHKELIAKIVAEESLKAHYSKISRLEAQLNGLQSIFRHLQSTSR